MPNPGIEAIYPLTFMQQALLFHHMQEVSDQGLLHLHCTLTGKLEPKAFQEAWEKTIIRHTALRTSIHWQEIDKPVQIVHTKSSMPWIFKDWTDVSAKKRDPDYEALKKELHAQGLDLSSAPVSRITLVQISGDTHYLLWDCHHILLDGWSVNVVLSDVFAHYDSIISGRSVQFESVPSYPAFIKWMQGQDLTGAKIYWKEIMRGFESPNLIDRPKPVDAVVSPSFKDYKFSLSEEVTNEMEMPTTRGIIEISADAVNGSDIIIITGNTSLRGSDITLTVKSPIGNMVTIAQVSPSVHGDFEVEIKAGGSMWKEDGAYTVTASQGRSSEHKESIQVEIKDGVVVPEFGVIATLVLAISIMSIIIVSSKARPSIFSRY